MEKRNHNDQTPEFVADADLLGSNSNIAVKLKEFYKTLQDEPIPNKFLDLLEKLDQAEEATTNKQKENGIKYD